MDRSIGRKVIAALLPLLMTSAAAPAPEAAYRAARALYDRSEFKAAVAAADAALARFGHRDDDAVWRLRELRAIALVDSGKWQAVLDAASPPLPPRLRKSEAAVDRLRALAIASYQSNRFDDTDCFLYEAELLASSSHPKMLADVYLARANMRRAFLPPEREHAARDALAAARRMKDLTVQLKATGTLGFILATEERYDEAIDAGEETLRVATALGNESIIQKTEGNLGWYYNELGDPESAAAHLQRALALCVKLGADGNRVTDLLQLGETEVASGDLASAKRHFTDARDLAATTASPSLGSALMNLAQLAARSGDVATARQMNAQAIALNQKAKEKEAVFTSRILDARLDAMSGQLESARATLESVIAGAKSKALQWEAHGQLALVYAALGNERLAEEHFRNAVDKTEEARDDIQNDERRLAFPELAKALNDAYIDFLITKGRARDALHVSELNRARTLAEGLRGDAAGDASFEPERVVREANVVALSYWLAPKRSFLWVVKPAGVQAFALAPSPEIESAIASYQSALAGPRGTLAGSGAEGRRLYKLLIEPAAASLRGASRVAVIPDGRLSVFNIETAVVPDPKPHYWIEDVTVQRAPSLQLLAASRADVQRDRMLLIGDAPQADPAFPPLRHAHAEIARVREHFPRTTTLAGSQATPRAYLASAPESYAFLHFVAHGVAARQRPLDSAVILGRDRDGYKLYARDIIEHPLRARLVTISSCHGAGRRSFAGEGLVGLAWAFLRAGAHEVIAALWEVNDEATPDLMDAMYAALRSGRDPAESLRIAKLKMLRSNTIYRKPLYWAPFVLYSGR